VELEGGISRAKYKHYGIQDLKVFKYLKLDVDISFQKSIMKVQKTVVSSPGIHQFEILCV
jgi:phosphoribosylformylglycinamidine (FGAM) synthase PurS component